MHLLSNIVRHNYDDMSFRLRLHVVRILMVTVNLINVGIYIGLYINHIYIKNCNLLCIK